MKMTFRFFSEIKSPRASFFQRKNCNSKNEWFSIYNPSKLCFLTILVWQVSHINDVTTRSHTVNKVNLMQKGKFWCPQSLNYLASNSIKLGMSPFYPLNCYIPEAVKNRRISSEENGCRTEAAEQVRTAT